MIRCGNDIACPYKKHGNCEGVTELCPDDRIRKIISENIETIEERLNEVLLSVVAENAPDITGCLNNSDIIAIARSEFFEE